MYNAVAMQPISSKFIKQVRIRESLGARWPIVGPIWVFNVGPNLDPGISNEVDRIQSPQITRGGEKA